MVVLDVEVWWGEEDYVEAVFHKGRGRGWSRGGKQDQVVSEGTKKTHRSSEIPPHSHSQPSSQCLQTRTL